MEQNRTLCAQYAAFTQQIPLQYIAEKQAIGTAFLIIENQSSALWYLKNTYTPLKEKDILLTFQRLTDTNPQNVAQHYLVLNM